MDENISLVLAALLNDIILYGRRIRNLLNIYQW